MKVLQVNSFFSAGGPPRIMNGIYTTLKQNGHDCKIAAARESIIVDEDSISIGNKRRTMINAFEARILDNDGFTAKKATRQLIERIEAYDPVVIQIHNLHGYYINIEILFDYLKACGKPIVWTMHDCWPITGHCPHFAKVKCERYKNGCYSCPLKKEYPSSYGFDHSKQNWERKKAAFTKVPNMTIVCVSQWLEQIIQESFLKEYKTKVIYNGIDLNVFKRTDSDFRKKYNLGNKRILVGVALHWGEKKGLLDYIELAKMLNEEYKIILVGLSEGEVKDLPHNIIPIPPVKDDRTLAEIYSASDLCLNLSYEETFGLTTIEALACDTPVITYDKTAVPEVARMYNAPVVRAGCLEELKEAIEKHFILNINKKKYDVACFEQEKQYQQYCTLYKELTEKK